MTLPRPAHTDRAMMTDDQIKSLAFAVDAAIGSAYRTAVLPAGYSIGISGSDSRAWITFPGLGAVSGALVWAARGAPGVAGARTEYPPVPPASIGWTLPSTPPYITVVQFGNGGTVLIECQTLSTNRGMNNGVMMQWGAQKAVGAPTIPLLGLAWGPV